MRNALIVVLGLLACQAPAQDEYLKKSVVKIFTVMKPADYYQPWQMGYQQQGVGSGLIMAGNVILTNAHVVSDQVHLEVLKAGDTRKVTAHVKFVGHDCELAMLTVDDPDFFKGTLPVKFGDMPHQRDKVAAYGFPAGGEELSITEGVVSRIEMQTYVHSQRSLLTIQTDAAINPGNSGGPVFKEGKVVGISFQSFAGTRVENTGYIIPLPVINHFLKDIADGHYDGVPSLGLFTQKMENQSLKDYYKLPKGEEGLIVTKVVYGSPCDGLVQEGDVLTKFAGVKIAGNGTIPFDDNGRVFFANLLINYQMGDKAKIELLRDGARKEVEVTFKDFEALVARPQYDIRPSYFVYAGFVFTPLSFNYLKVWGWNDVSSRFRYLFESGLPSPQKRQIVFINQVLPHDVNSGYHRMSQVVVDKINGINISEMKDVISALQKPLGGYHIIESENFYADPDSAASKIVLNAEKCEAANKEILGTFAIPSDRSEDLK